MSCAAAVESFVALLDGEIGAGERRTIELHLGACPSCAGELELLRLTRELISRQMANAVSGCSAGSFDALWRRIEASERPLHVIAGGVAPRPARRRRLAVWMGTGGLALAAGLALMVVGLQRDPSQPVVATPSAAVGAQRAPAAQAKAVPRAAVRVAAKVPVKEGARLAKRTPLDGAEGAAEDQVAEVANEIDPPPELLDRPDLFINYPMVRKLDELQHLESVLADPADEGGAG